MAFRIYTKTGDAGQTALFGGRRVSKADLRVEAYGTLDELNAFIGVLRDGMASDQVPPVLTEVQRRLFSLGAYLASDPDKPQMALDLLDSDVDLLVVMRHKGAAAEQAARIRCRIRPGFPLDIVVRSPAAIRKRLASASRRSRATRCSFATQATRQIAPWQK